MKWYLNLLRPLKTLKPQIKSLDLLERKMGSGNMLPIFYLKKENQVSDMEKIKLDIVGLSYSQTQSGAYALVLGEKDGKRRLPIIIGGFEAQAIAIELEDMTPSRPLTHDLFKSFADSFEIKIKEVIIYNLVEGIFYAKLMCEKNGEETEIDTRTSDAIALAVRFNCPIFTHEFILSSAGIILEDEMKEEKGDDEKVEEVKKKEEKKEEQALKKGKVSYSKLSTKKLKELLEKAINSENYEEASLIRDEINSRKKSD